MSLDLTIFVLRIGILVLLYVFLAQIAAIILRDIKATSAETAQRMPRGMLTVLDGQVEGSSAGEAILLEAENTLGRAAGNSIRLLDDFVSAQHAVISARGQTWWIEDMGSTNGTLLNGKQVAKPTKVTTGDVIQIGMSKLRLGKR